MSWRLRFPANYRARYYNATLQRFISEDPIGLEGGDANFYVYTADSPTNFIDPFGLDKKDPWRRVKCANEFANNHSLAALLPGAQNTFLGKALGGNAIAGVGELAVAVAAPTSNTNPVELGAGIAVGGAGLGVAPVGGPGVKGATGLLQDAVVKGTVQEMNTLLSSSAAQLSVETLENAANVVGWVKLIGDAGVYLTGVYQCR
jgi:hypothetical protein